MSSILKALRRLEEERARKSHAPPEIAVSLLRDNFRRRKASFWLWPVVVVAVILGAVLLVWSFRSLAPPVAIPPVVRTTPAAQPPSAARGGEVIIEEVIDRRIPAAAPPSSPAEVKVAAPLAAPDASPPPETAATPKPPVPPVECVVTPAEPALAERSAPAVSAIAWQEERALRMAVIDGLPVMTGETVGTATVEEIRPDRVIFSAGGESFFVRSSAP